jgi:membrane fusion protein (multidrug efflux system)
MSIATGDGVMRAVAPLLAAGLLVAAGCEKEQAAGPPPAPPKVTTITIEPERVALTRELPGRTAAWQVAEVRPQVGGLVRERLFEEGSDVEEGQVLYQLDDAPFRSAVQSAEANLKAAQSKAGEVRADVKTSEAAVAEEQAVLDLAEQNLKRATALAAEGAESQSEKDRYTSQEKVARAALASARAELERDRQAVAVADAEVARAEAALERARIDLEYARITAPIAGRIGRSAVTVGSLVTAYQGTPLATIQQLDPIYVDVPQSYGDLLKLRRRLRENHLESDPDVVDRVRLVLEDGEAYAQEGTLKFREAEVDQSTSSVFIRMVFPNPEGVLLPGMFVRAVVTDGVDPQGILVPQEAVARNTKAEPIAMVVGGDGVVEQRTLVLEREVGNKWLVAEGLEPGEQVITEGLQRVRHGMTVEAVPAAQTADAAARQ